jgi:thiol-disulfide isomerase/thioredoxin
MSNDMTMTGGRIHCLTEDPPFVDIGPFHVTRVTEYTRGATVGWDNVPVVLYEARVKIIDGVPTKQEKYAVMVPPRKDVGLVCAGCYTPTMTLFNNSRCVSCRTFAKHLDTLGDDGPRKCLCLNQDPVTKLEAVMDRVRGEGSPNPPDVNMVEIESWCDMLEALKSRHEDGLAGYLNHIEDRDILKHLDNIELSDIIKYVQARDPTLVLDKVKGKGPYLFDSSFEKLEAEMRRRVAGTDTTRKRFYNDHNSKKHRRREPHYTDAPVVTWEYMCDAMFERSNGRG